MFLLEKRCFCKNCDNTLCFRTLRGEIDPGESEFDLESMKQKLNKVFPGPANQLASWSSKSVSTWIQLCNLLSNAAVLQYCCSIAAEPSGFCKNYDDALFF